MCEAVKTAAKKTLPRKANTTTVQRQVSQRTKDLYKEKRRLQQQYQNSHTKSTKKIFKDIQRRIKTSCLNDYREWIEATVTGMEKVNEAGDIKTIYRLVNSITSNPGKPPNNLTTDKNGQLLQSPEATANAWRDFLQKKFEPTEAEKGRPSMETIPKTTDPISVKEFENAVKKLNQGKATVNSISKGSKEDADMFLNTDKLS